MRFAAAAAALVVMIAAPLSADHIALTGNMNATMTQGETRTFTLDIEFRTAGHTGNLDVAVTADRGLRLGKTTVQGPFTCSESPRANTCRGNVNMTASQKITMTQELTATEDAFGSLIWAVQLVGAGLSGVDPAKGVILLSAPRPHVIVTKYPESVLVTRELNEQLSFSLKNVGDAGTTVALSTPAVFFLSSQSISLAPGQEATVTGRLQNLAEGYFVERVSITGIGVPADTSVLLRGAVTFDRPSTPPAVVAAANRFDEAGEAGTPQRSIDIPFSNTGSGKATGVISVDVPWLVPPAEVITIEPGQTRNVRMTIDTAVQTRILEGTGGAGSLTGTATLHYLLPAPQSGGVRIAADGPGTASSSTAVVSTITINLATATIPPMPENHAQLFVPGLGHVQGSVGLFISDLSIFPQVERGVAAMRYRSLSDLDLYFTPLGGGTSKKVSMATLAVPDVAAFGDVVGTVYKENRVGSLQIRTPGFLAGSGVVGVNANVFNVSDPKGTLGTSIPVFAYGKYQCPQEIIKRIYLTGLRKDSSGHTNFYVQETCGAASSVRLTFLDPAGNSVGTTNVDVPAFAAVQIGSNAMPEGAVSAVLQHNSGSAGGFVAYATPVDRASGDTWAQVDWPNLYRYDGSVQVLIPVAGATAGANNTYFRTDLSIMNTGTTPGSGTLRYHNRNGEVLDRTVNLNGMQTVSYSDVTTTLFGVTAANVGYLMFLPASGRFVLTSRNYSTPAGSSATFGTAVPTLEFGSALRSGQIRRIGGIDDASGSRGATFRSNMGLIETTGNPVTVKVTIYYRHVGSLASTILGGSATIDLAPRQFLLTNVASAVFGAGRPAIGDLRNAMVEFEVVGGTGGVLPFISSVDNGTGDSTFRIE